MSIETVILVDEQDNPIGEMEKMEAHRKGLLHRAFSGFVFNDRGELLIQQRSATKYHNANIWTNTVCSHPRLDETIPDAAKRRLKEELGFELEFSEVGSFLYKVKFENGLTEHELDHVCVAHYGGQAIKPNPDEVQDIQWISLGELKQKIASRPDDFSYWLKKILEKNLVASSFVFDL